MRTSFEYALALVAAFLLGGAIAFAVEMRERAREAEEWAATVEDEAEIWVWKAQTGEESEEFCCPKEWIQPLPEEWTREEWEEVLRRCEP